MGLLFFFNLELLYQLKYTRENFSINEHNTYVFKCTKRVFNDLFFGTLIKNLLLGYTFKSVCVQT